MNLTKRFSYRGVLAARVVVMLLVGAVPVHAGSAGDGRREGLVGGKLWPNGVIPYRMDPAVKNANTVLAAMRHWSERTVIRFVPRTSEADFVTFKDSPDATFCVADIGRLGG